MISRKQKFNLIKHIDNFVSFRVVLIYFSECLLNQFIFFVSHQFFFPFTVTLCDLTNFSYSLFGCIFTLGFKLNRIA